MHYVTVLWFKSNSKIAYKMNRVGFSLTALCIFISFMLFFLLCNQISQNLARTKSSVLCYFDLLFIKMLWVQINLLCKYLLLFYLTWNGSCRHFDNESRGCLASPYLLELLLSLTEMISCNFLLGVPREPATDIPMNSLLQHQLYSLLLSVSGSTLL